MNRVVFAVDWKERLTLPTRLSSDQISSGDQTLFVREPDRLPCPDRFVRCLKSSDSHDSANDEIRLRMRGNTYIAFWPAEHWNIDSSRLQPILKFRSGLVGCHGNQLGSPSAALLKRDIDIPSCRQGSNAEALGIGLDDPQRAQSNGSGGTEDSYSSC